MATILVVDDEVDVLEIVRFRLEQDGHAVLTASDGQMGLSRAIQDHPDLIILDLMMPVMDGFDALERLKKNPALAKIPVLLLTARADYASRARGWEGYAEEYLTKPFDVDTLARTVENLLTHPNTTAKN